MSSSVVEVYKHLLIDERVGFVGAEVIECPELLVEKARRPCNREHPARLDVIDIANGPIDLPRALSFAQRVSCCRRRLVDHRIPNGAGELQQMRVHVTQLREFREIGWTSIVLIE